MNKVYHGDCLEIMDDLIKQGIKFDAIITDPPYGTTACKWDTVIDFHEMWLRLKQLRKEKTPIVLFGSEPFSSALRMSNIKEFKYDWIWHKSQPSGMTFKKQPMRNHENISVFGNTETFNGIPEQREGFTEGSKKRIQSGKLSHTINGNPLLGIGGDKSVVKLTDLRKPTTIRKVASVPNKTKKSKGHPTQKPVKLLEYLIKTYTNENDLVLDFTAGSGTTAIACINTNRQYIIIEKEKKYIDIINERIEKAKKEKQELLF